MPKEVQEERIFGPHTEMGETYRQYRDRLKDDDSMTASRAAALMATTMLMKGRANMPMDSEEFYRMSKTLREQTAFKQMMKDPKSRELLRKGDGRALVELFADKEYERQNRFKRYERPKEFVREDARVLGAAIGKLEKKAPEPDSPENRSRLVFHQKMMERMHEAKTLADEGKQLTGEQAKKLINSLRAYNDAESARHSGDELEAQGKTDVMCVLSRYMPEKEFRTYCKSINRQRGAEKSDHKDHADPEAYSSERLTGQAKTAEEWLAESRVRLMREFTVEGCAEAAALQKLCKGNPKKAISKEELERETARFASPQSAISRTLRDSVARKEYIHLALNCKTEELGTKLLSAARKHSAQAAQWQMNQSIRALTSGPVNRYTAAENLANILAARELAAAGDAGRASRTTRSAPAPSDCAPTPPSSGWPIATATIRTSGGR